MNLKCITVALASLPFVASAADYYEYCNQILVNGTLQTYQSTSNYEAKIALKKWLCSHESSSSGGGGGLELNVIDIFSLGGGGQSAKQWKKEHCSGTDYDYEGSKSSHILIQHSNDSVVNAWSQCIKDIRPEKLACYAKETENSLLMTVELGYGIGNVEKAEVVGTNLNPLTSIPNRFRPGKKNLRYKIENPRYEAYFDLNGEADYIDVSCSYTIPSKPVSEDGNEGCEVFRLQSLSKGKITGYEYEYLREMNQVPLFSSNNGELIGYYSCSEFE
ncbi:hypothetical protein [Spartinivicinus poritis]|uniref:Uncharacterized protein n=1 Tax=Spartinivicinus poritis TaxID=2994640 RepID=A0ABT5U8Y5_9GAMM|nr:hypothetical protein [Spartinivicinus sp. A2-2]MDE1462012.1 hypothetical protein [Spartinivicinus sp. A2-2]